MAIKSRHADKHIYYLCLQPQSSSDTSANINSRSPETPFVPGRLQRTPGVPPKAICCFREPAFSLSITTTLISEQETYSSEQPGTGKLSKQCSVDIFSEAPLKGLWPATGCLNGFLSLNFSPDMERFTLCTIHHRITWSKWFPLFIRKQSDVSFFS